VTTARRARAPDPGAAPQAPGKPPGRPSATATTPNASAANVSDAAARDVPLQTVTSPPTHEQRSLFGEILDWMLAPLLLLWPMSVALTWLVAQSIANRPYDRELGEMARTLSTHVTIVQRAEGMPEAVLSLPKGAADVLRTDEADDRYFQVLGLRGELLGGDVSLPAPAYDERPRPGELQFRDAEVDGTTVRLAVLAVAPAASGPAADVAVVQVAETLSKRSQLATEIIKGVILPQFVILPLAVLLVWLALARGIAPLNALQQRIRRRDSHDLRPIDEREAPEEVAPLVRAINDLLTRLDQSMASQKHFLADAAHQLKTPLAGLRMQAEVAQREIDSGSADLVAVQRSLAHISRSSQNAAHMVNQLLAMARAEASEHLRRPEPADLAALALETVQDFVPKALDKRIDLGYEGAQGEGGATADDASADAAASPRALVLGQPVLLRELIRNLVDNALQYTPAGGTVTVRIIDDPFGQVVVLQVEDSGPGIPAAEREKVFHPFYRALGTNVDGSGLGLAIVREIAQQHAAEVTLEDANLRHRSGLADQGVAAFGPGARFTVRFAAARREPPPAAAAATDGTGAVSPPAD
jgi:two-component system, OmpR family, sensor histidine kinase TctE